MENIDGELAISTDKSKLDMDKVCDFLSRSYWANKRPRETILKSIENSICYGAYIGDRLVGFARVVTDGATMYWLCDVFVDEEYRGQKLVGTITNADEFKDLNGLLATKDAHGLYEQYHFTRMEMMRRMADYIRNMDKGGSV
ncbi:GNAT family N-acetyltransferase [Paenibacillus sp. Y412MC10]|uniref:GNAT family N-acetyltransferase n=1 Tax=Geobacillus sp. (strain Y412MC10) TaxID=481743 RepID=UPI00119CCE0E|nr:GNAT family N-acetyltransferase [Paenibacillus sp. Y412MC10]